MRQSHAFACWAAGRFEESVASARLLEKRGVAHAGVMRVLAASLAEVGRTDEARAVVAELMRFAPGFRISLLERILPPQPALLPRFAEALRKAGAPE